MVVVSVAIDNCVLETSIHAFFLNYNSIAPTETTTSFTVEHKELDLEML